jgi:hypothetical protein
LLPTYVWSLDNLVVSVPEPELGAFLLSWALALGILKLRDRRQKSARRQQCCFDRAPVALPFGEPRLSGSEDRTDGVGLGEAFGQERGAELRAD